MTSEFKHSKGERYALLFALNKIHLIELYLFATIKKAFRVFERLLIHTVVLCDYGASLMAIGVQLSSPGYFTTVILDSVSLIPITKFPLLSNAS